MTVISEKIRKEGFALKRKKIVAAVLCGLMLCLSGCAANTAIIMPEQFKDITDGASLQSGTVAENSNFKLNWDAEQKNVILYDIANNTEWASNPSASEEVRYDEFGMPIKTHPLVSSDVYIKYIDSKSEHQVTANSYNGAIRNGKIVTEKIKNGIKVIYYFTESEISIPVEYVLRENGMAMTVKTKEISEGSNKLIEVSLAPFYCSVSNTAGDSYLMIPSGSGALVYPKVLSNDGESYRQEIYGNDLMVTEYDKVSNEEEVRLPVFGAKNGNKALCVIIEGGAESGFIDAVIGGSTYQYSSVYATVRVRGYNLLRNQVYTGNTIESDYYTDGINGTEFTVSYTPLYDDKANYTGMAETYRNYLLESEQLSKHSEKQESFSVTIYGGFMAEKSFLGIPYKSLKPLTTISEAQEIITELSEQTDNSFSVYLQGFGNTGIDLSKLADGYKIGDAFGNLKELNLLSDYCVNNGVSAYFNFDVLRFTKAGFGHMKMFSSAKTANGKSYYPTNYLVSLRNRVPSDEYALIKLSDLQNGINKLLDKTQKWEIEGYGFDSLGSIAYSDYSSIDSWNKRSVPTEVSKAMTTVVDSGKKVATVAANAYAANADRIFSAPLSSARFSVFDEDIPFYEIVFKGYTPMSSEAINISALPEDTLLAAVESGITPHWSLMYGYDNAAVNINSEILHNGVWERCGKEIIQTVNELSDYYKSISDAEITSHNVKGGVRETVFSNGVTVAVNRGDTEQESVLGTLKAGEYRIGGINR